MQLLFSSSQEFGYSNGLKLINGKVKKFSKQNSLQNKYGMGESFNEKRRAIIK